MPNLIGNSLDAQIVRMVKALFDAAPGYTFLTALKAQGSVQSVSETLNANFSSLSNAQWASLIATNLKLTGGAATAAQNYLIGQLNSGVTRVALLPAAMQGLTNLESDGTFGAAAAYFNASNATAYAYSINPANTTTDLAILQTRDEPPPPNRAPVAGNDTNSATEGGAVIAGTVAVNDSDPDGDTLTYQLAPTQAPVAGFTLNANGGYTFDPTVAAYNDLAAGATRAVVINLWVRDGQTQTPSTLTITVTGTNDAPTAAAVVASGNEDSTITVTPSATDPDTGDTLTFAVNSQPANGSVVLNTNGTFTYTPRANFNGTDSFTYRVTDVGGLSSIATATVTVTSVNDRPTATESSITVNEGSSIAGAVTGTDIDGDILSYAVSVQPSNGTLTFNQATGAFVYTPKPGFVGDDSFSYTVNDGTATSAATKVNIKVEDVPNILTSNVDVINLTGSGSQTVLGNESTYNSGDSITGGSGDGDIMRLQLNPTNLSGNTSVSSARVSGIETFQVSANPTIVGQTIELLMTNVTGLQNLELNRSTAQNIAIRDIQAAGTALPVVKINDVGANVTINVDQQDVSGSADTLKVEVNEFGTNSSTTFGRPVLDITSGSQRIETVELTDNAASTGFASDISVIQGTYSQLNIKGGAAGVSLTIQDTGTGGGFSSTATTLAAGSTTVFVSNVTVDSTAFAGNLVADVDGADTLLAGAGNDVLRAHFAIDGLISMAGGNDSLTSTSDLTGGTVQGGDGNDTISFAGSLNGFATTTAPVRTGISLIEGGAGNDSVTVSGSVNSLGTIAGGEGDDTVRVGDNLNGTVTGGAGSDQIWVNVTSTTVSGVTTFSQTDLVGSVGITGLIDGGDGDDTIRLLTPGGVTGSVLGGAGNDTILNGSATTASSLGNNATVTSPAAQGLIDGGDGDDTIEQWGTMQEGSRVLGGAGNDNITVAGTIEGNLADPTTLTDAWQVAATVDAGDGDDTVTVASGTFNGVVTTGAGNDSVVIASAVVDGTGAVSLGDGDDSIKLVNRSWTAGTADGLGNDDAIAGGNGADSMTLESISTFPANPAQTVVVTDQSLTALQANGTVSATFFNTVGTPPANVVVTVNNGATMLATLQALAAAINANATVAAYWTATVNADNDLVLTTNARGNDTPLVTFTNVQIITQAGATVDAEAGVYTFGTDPGGDRSWAITSDGVGTLVTGDVQDGTDITGIETLNLTTADGFNGDENANVAGTQDSEYDHTFTVALEAFDTALTTINVLERDDAVTVNLTGYASEQINIDSDGRSKVTGDSDDVDAADVTLNINDTQTSAARAANIALNGTAAYSTIINDDARINVMNLAINGTGNRTVTLDSADQDNNDTVGGEGNTLNITGDNTGTHTITGIYQETVAAGGFGGNLNLTIANDGDGGNETLSITTGSGNDVINMVADRLDYTVNVGTGAVTGDSINGGAGTDRLIIDNSTTTSGNSIDQDFVFKRITSIEELEVRGNDGGTLNVSIENDANITGIRKVVASNNGAQRGNINLNFESDFAVGGVAPAVVVDVESSDIVIDNGANSNMALNLFAARASAGGAASGVYAGFVAASGTGSGVVDVNVTINGTGTTWVGGVSNLAGGFVANVGAGVASGLASGVAGVVILDTQIGTIDSLTLTDNGTTDNAVNVTWNDAWANGVASFPVTMALVNNDSTAGGGGLTTGGVNFVGVAEDDTGFNITASANNDTIWGGQSNDVISAGAGNDFINADPTTGQIVAPGSQGAWTVNLNSTDAIDAGDVISVTIGTVTQRWTAPQDYAAGLGQQAAATALAALFNNANVDGDAQNDISASASGSVITITGIDIEPTFGYVRGQDYTPTGLTASNRATATVTIPVGNYDAGDVVSFTVTNGANSEVFSYTVPTGQTLTAAQVAFNIVNNSNNAPTDQASVLLDPNNPSNVISVFGNLAATSYQIVPSIVNAPAQARYTANFTGQDGGESVAITFANGTTIAAANTTQLANDITGLFGYTATATSPTQIQLFAAATPTQAVTSAAVTGGNGGTGSVTAGTGPFAVTANAAPAMASRQMSFSLNDAFYDAGDQISIVTSAGTYTVTLPGVDDTNHSAATVAAVLQNPGANSATVNSALPTGYTVSAVGNVVTVTAPTNGLSTWAVSINDVTPVGPTPEVVTVNFANLNASNETASVVIGGTTYSAAWAGSTTATLTALATNINGDLPAGWASAVPSGTNLVITGLSSGAEPSTTVSGASVVATTPITPVTATAPVLATVATATATVGSLGVSDVMAITVGGITYAQQFNGVSTASTMTALANQISGANIPGWTVTSVAQQVVFTGPANGSNPAAAVTSAVEWNYNTGTAADAPITNVAANQADAAVVTINMSAVTTLNGISATFRIEGQPNKLISGTSLIALRDAINADATVNALWTASIQSGNLVLTGPASGVDPTDDAAVPTAVQLIDVNIVGTGTVTFNTTVTPDTTVVQYSDTVNFAALNAAGEAGWIRTSNGETYFAEWNTDIATTLTTLRNAFNASTTTGLTAAVVGSTLVFTGNVNGATPAGTISDGQVLSNVDDGDAATLVTVSGVPATPAVVNVNFSGVNAAGESARITFANGDVYTVPFNTSPTQTVTDLISALNAADATPANGDVTSASTWTATQAGATLILTGPANGVPSSIGVTSAAELNTEGAAVAVTTESFINLDNTNPSLNFVSGRSNANPTTAVQTANVPAITAAGTGGNDSVNGGDGNDTINGGGGNDTLFGDAGNDVLDGGDGNDQTWGGAGDDFATGGNGNDVMVGAEGNDTMDGGSGNDNISGGDGPDRLTGADGNDTVDGGSGDDFIRGGAGRDLLTGGDGTDVFYFPALSTASESQGAVNFADVVTDFVSNVDKFQFDFTVNFYANVTNTTNLLAGLTDVSPAAGPAAGRAIFDSSAKILFVDVNGDGAITLSNDIVIDLTQTNVTGLSSSDFIAPSGSATVTGTAGNDLLIGEVGNQALLGLDGDDTLFGAGGTDTLTGGNGADTFHFASSGDPTNTIVDFVSGTDKLQFTTTTVAYAGTATNAGTAATALGSVDASLRAAGKAVLVPAASSTTAGTLYIDVDGDGTADITLTLTGVTSLSQADFLAPEPPPGL